MSLIQLAPSTPPAVEPLIPNVQSTPSKSTIVDTSIIPRKTLTAYVEGAPWLVNYYQRTLSKDMALYGHDASSTTVNQTYTKILNLELRLQGELSVSQNTTDKRFTSKGTAFIPQGVIANTGDMFAADVGDGREGIFEITTSTRKTMRDQAIYEIEFSISFIKQTDKPRFDDLEGKIINHVHFLRDYARHGKNPIVTDNTYHDLIQIQSTIRTMSSDYLRWFFSSELSAFIVPGQPNPTYDPFCDAFLRSVVDLYREPTYQRALLFSIQQDNHSNDITFWDMLLQRQYDLISGCRFKFGVFGVGQLNRRPSLRSLYHSRIKTIVYPYPVEQGIDSMYNGDDFVLSQESLAIPIQTGGASQNSDRINKPSDIILEPTKAVNFNGFYVLSEAFYTDGAEGDLSLLEKLTLDFCKGKPVNSSHLRWLISNYRSWPALYRYYYVPICMMLARSLVQEAI
jgi:hypothetical protein